MADAVGAFTQQLGGSWGDGDLSQAQAQQQHVPDQHDSQQMQWGESAPGHQHWEQQQQEQQEQPFWDEQAQSWLYPQQPWQPDQQQQQQQPQLDLPAWQPNQQQQQQQQLDGPAWQPDQQQQQQPQQSDEHAWQPDQQQPQQSHGDAGAQQQSASDAMRPEVPIATGMDHSPAPDLSSVGQPSSPHHHHHQQQQYMHGHVEAVEPSWGEDPASAVKSQSASGMAPEAEAHPSAAPSGQADAGAPAGDAGNEIVSVVPRAVDDTTALTAEVAETARASEKGADGFGNALSQPALHYSTDPADQEGHSEAGPRAEPTAPPAAGE